MLYKNKIEIIINSILLLIKKIIHKEMKKVLANNDKENEIYKDFCSGGCGGCQGCGR